MNRNDYRLIGEAAEAIVDPVITWKVQYNRFLDSLEKIKITILKDKTVRERTHTPGGDLGPPVELTYIQFRIDGPLYLPANLPYDTGHFKNEREFLNSELFADLPDSTPPTFDTKPSSNPIERLLKDQALQVKEDRVTFKVKTLRIVRDPVNPDMVQLFVEALLEAEKSLT